MGKPLFAAPEQIRRFTSELRTERIGRELVFLAETESTNDLALDAGRRGDPHGKVFVADRQTRGRGRRGREWSAPGGVGLLFSVLVRPVELKRDDLGWLPLLAGIAAVEALRETCALSVTIKWPNDIVIPSPRPPGWRKLGGILCESVIESDAGAGSFVVIGIGINVNQSSEDFPPQTKAPPTSIRLELGRAFDRQMVLAGVLESLEKYFLELCDASGSSSIKHAIERELRSWWRERTLHLDAPGENSAEPRRVTGKFSRLDGFGRLVLEEDGRQVSYADAEIVRID